jgi:hypothetical protein
MTTRSSAKSLFPLTDPEEILKNSRRQKRLDAAAGKNNSVTHHNLSDLPALPPSPTMSDTPETSSKAQDSSNAKPTTSLTLDDYLKGIMKLQHQSIDQANVDRSTIMESLKFERELRQADADRIARLEEAVLRMSVKSDPETQSTRVETGRIDLQRFRSSDGPLFLGPFQDVERFITWLRGVQIFLATKGVTHDDDKIQVVGGLIRETNTTAFYASGFDGFLGKPWADFKAKLIAFALPPNWRTTLRGKFKNLRMQNSESFLTYSTRSRTLQSMLNFELKTEAVSDFDLAESMTLGTNDLLQAEINNHQLLLQDPFVFSTYENRASGFWDGLVKRTAFLAKPRTNPAANSSTNSPQAGRLPKEEYLWRIRSFLDSQGKCHFCKKQCGSAPGKCAGPIDKSPIEIPASFTVPPKPSDYKPPRAKGLSQSSAGKATQPPAGRPTNRSASVAGVTESDLFPDLDEAAVSAFAAIDEELRATSKDEYVPPTTPRRLIIRLKAGDHYLLGLVDTGAEINLITERAVKKAKLPILDLLTPTRVTLALKDDTRSPVILKQFTRVNLMETHTKVDFKEVELSIGEITGNYDMILGTPFLSRFHLSVSISQHSLHCDETDQIVLDYRTIDAMIPKKIPSVPNEDNPVYPREESEEAVLKEFADLFPADIPAVSDEAELSGLFKDGSFPERMQNEDSKVRHKIVLTDPNAQINERQYSYPQKYMTAWRKLLDQHIEAGRIRRSSSQYASPSMIIPKKDPTALPRWVCDYRTLNSFTVKDRSPLPNVDELIRMVATGKVFSILDQTNAFFQTRMREADIPLTAVKTPWGLMEWVVMPMGLTNAPATHQARLEEALGGLINTICVVYLDDIVVFSDSFSEHEKHVRQVLQRLRSANLYCSPKKTQLFRHRIKFLGHWISAEGIQADNEKIAQILDWKSPSSAKGVKKFLGTVQWMKKFIWGLQKYVGTLTPLTSSKLAPKEFHWGPAEEKAFENIKRIMTSLPCLKNVDYKSDDPLWLFTDASGSGLGAALFQGKDWKVASPIAYESHLMTPAERNYPVHEQELLAVIHALQKWKMLLLGMKVNVMTDHHSLTYLLKQRNLSRRQARWLEILSDFDIHFEYIKGEDNSVADALSRKEITEGDGGVTRADIACVASLTELGSTLSDSIRTKIMSGYAEDNFCKSVKKVLPLRDDCAEVEGLLVIDGRLVIPDNGDLRRNLISETHIRLGHLGYLKTLVELRRDFFWPQMAKQVAKFVQSCETCQKTKAPTTAPTGKMLTPSFPRTPLSDLAIDFVGPLKTSNHYDMILTCTCRLSGFTRIIPCLQTDTAERSASRLFNGWLALFGAPQSILSDRDKTWTSHFWKALMEKLRVKFHMTTSFHPQADGRSERTNKTVGQILRSFTAKRQGKWLEALPAVEFAINSAVNVSTGYSPFELIFGRKPQLFPFSESSTEAPLKLTDWSKRREVAWQEARDALWTSRIKQAIQHNKHTKDRPPLTPDSWALLDSADWRGRHQGGVDKLKERFEGPYRVVRVSNHGQDVELELPEGDRRHPTFHISKLKSYHTPEDGEHMESWK